MIYTGADDSRVAGSEFMRLIVRDDASPSFQDNNDFLNITELAVAAFTRSEVHGPDADVLHADLLISDDSTGGALPIGFEHVN